MLRFAKRSGKSGPPGRRPLFLDRRKRLSTHSRSLYMTIDEEKRRQIEGYFLGLTADERREQIYLKPEFRDAYNEITEAHRIFVLPQYYFKNWRHVLGPVVHTLYEEMRRRTFYNPQTGERRDSFYATQDDLAESIGVKSPKTISKALKALEENGFIRRQVRHYKDPQTGRPYRGADLITVYFEIPLTVADGVELLLNKESASHDSVFGKKYRIQSRDAEETVDNTPVKGNFYRIRARENIPSNVDSTSDITNNVRTLVEKTSKETTGQAPSSYLVDLLGRKLGRVEENRRYYESVCAQYPEAIIMQALAAVEDKFLNSLDPAKEGFRVNKAAYFTGVLKNLKKKEI
jgi:SOS-response transcriptional repressor LexA